jgi:hypothetical protein
MNEKKKQIVNHLLYYIQVTIYIAIKCKLCFRESLNSYMVVYICKEKIILNLSRINGCCTICLEGLGGCLKNALSLTA